MTSCVVTQEELGQQPKKHKENTHSIAGWINVAETRIGGASVGNAEKAGPKADSV